MPCQPCIADAVIVEPAVTAAAAANAISNLRTMTLLHLGARTFVPDIAPAPDARALRSGLPRRLIIAV
jgi:hypothetical protein